VRPIVVRWLEHYLSPDAASTLAPTWFMCVGIAGLVSLCVMLVLARRRGIESSTVASVMLWGYIAAVTAGIVVPMTIEAIEHLFATGHLQFRWAGMTSFWGYLAGAAAVAAVCKAEGVPVARKADLAAIPIGIALVFARLGCFMAGCDYGKVSSLPWAVRFPAGSPAWRDQIHAGWIPAGRFESLPVHPTQLYEAMLGIVIVLVAWVVARRSRTEGRAFLAAAATYAIGRLLIEIVRGDVGRGIYGGLSSGQIFSLLVLLAIAARFAVTRRVMAIATAVVIGGLVVGPLGGKAYAQSAPTDDRVAPATDAVADTADPPPVPNTTTSSPPVVDSPQPIGPVYPLRPIFAAGVLLGVAKSANRPGEQVPSLWGESLSLGYVPGRFGLWFDLDRLTNGEASHQTALGSVSFAPRVTSHLWIGARAGIGVTHVSFMNPAFENVTARTVRLEAIAEIVMNHNWVLWIRPLAIDVTSADALGGPITTFQFRAGLAYRFGERGHRPAPAQQPSPPDPPPQPYPTLVGP
jgi:prolipoprotein diacylglyceryltransferase